MIIETLERCLKLAKDFLATKERDNYYNLKAKINQYNIIKTGGYLIIKDLLYCKLTE